MANEATEFLTQWHRIVEERDLDALGTILAASPTMGAPPYWEKLASHDIVHHLLGIILQTIDGFEYHREWTNGRDLALEFTGEVSGLNLQGIDLITIDSAGQLVNIDVMIRPFNALQELIKIVAPQMAEFLSTRASKN